MEVQPHLVYDVGMHEGFDTAFYLKKGFHVIGIEANPDLANNVSEKFSEQINSGKLTILNQAISHESGEIDFFYYDNKSDWGTTDHEFILRNNRIYGLKYKKKLVQAETFGNILNQYGVPYYLKVDIEGADQLCLEAIASISAKPRYLSIEPDQISYQKMALQIKLLEEMGYRKFKLVDQSRLKEIKLPHPSAEGKDIDWQFTTYSSGPFGEDTPGHWLNSEQVKRKYRRIIYLQSFFGKEGGWNGRWCGTFAEKLFLAIHKKPLGWYDLHARYTL